MFILFFGIYTIYSIYLYKYTYVNILLSKTVLQLLIRLIFFWEHNTLLKLKPVKLRHVFSLAFSFRIAFGHYPITLLLFEVKQNCRTWCPFCPNHLTRIANTERFQLQLIAIMPKMSFPVQTSASNCFCHISGF